MEKTPSTTTKQLEMKILLTVILTEKEILYSTACDFLVTFLILICGGGQQGGNPGVMGGTIFCNTKSTHRWEPLKEGRTRSTRYGKWEIQTPCPRPLTFLLNVLFWKISILSLQRVFFWFASPHPSVKYSSLALL